MLSNEGERTLMSAIIPPYAEHINGIVGMVFSDEEVLLLSAGVFASLVGDFYVKIGQKSNVNMTIHLPSKRNCIKYLVRNIKYKISTPKVSSIKRLKYSFIHLVSNTDRLKAKYSMNLFPIKLLFKLRI